MLRGFAALFKRDLILDDGGDAPPSVAVAQPEPAPAHVVQREPVDDCGNYHAWPDDPDEVPEWVVAAEALRAQIGITAPLPARTLRQFWSQLEMCTVSIDTEDIVKVPPAPALSPVEAAREFCADLMAEAKELGERLEFSVQALAERYEAHCERENRLPCAIEQMKGKLARMPGCTRTKADERRNGRRYRPVVWIIDPERAALIDSIEQNAQQHKDNHTEIVPFRLAA